MRCISCSRRLRTSGFASALAPCARDLLVADTAAVDCRQPLPCTPRERHARALDNHAAVRGELMKSWRRVLLAVAAFTATIPLAHSAAPGADAPKIKRPALFFKEDWKQTAEGGEHP